MFLNQDTVKWRLVMVMGMFVDTTDDSHFVYQLPSSNYLSARDERLLRKLMSSDPRVLKRLPNYPGAAKIRASNRPKTSHDQGYRLY